MTFLEDQHLPVTARTVCPALFIQQRGCGVRTETRNSLTKIFCICNRGNTELNIQNTIKVEMNEK